MKEAGGPDEPYQETMQGRSLEETTAPAGTRSFTSPLSEDDSERLLVTFQQH